MKSFHKIVEMTKKKKAEEAIIQPSGDTKVGEEMSSQKSFNKEETQQGDTMSTMDKYLAAIEGKADFRDVLDEKTLTPAEMKKREEVAKAIERENPDMPMGKKMAIATATAKKVAEEVEELDEISSMTHAKYRDAARKDIKANLKHTDGEYGDLAKNIIDRRMKGLARSSAMSNLKKEEVEELEEKAHTIPKSEKEKDLAKLAHPHDKITHADVMVGRGVKKEELSSKEKMKRGLYNKEEMEVNEAAISYSEFKAKIDAHRKAGNKVVDDKYNHSTGTATYTTIDKEGYGRKLTHTERGTKVETLGKVHGTDDEAEDKPTEKRGRGRPAGTKSGARRHN